MMIKIKAAEEREPRRWKGQDNVKRTCLVEVFRHLRCLGCADVIGRTLVAIVSGTFEPFVVIDGRDTMEATVAPLNPYVAIVCAPPTLH